MPHILSQSEVRAAANRAAESCGYNVTRQAKRVGPIATVTTVLYDLRRRSIALVSDETRPAARRLPGVLRPMESTALGILSTAFEVANNSGVPPIAIPWVELLPLSTRDGHYDRRIVMLCIAPVLPESSTPHVDWTPLGDMAAAIGQDRAPYEVAADIRTLELVEQALNIG